MAINNIIINNVDLITENLAKLNNKEEVFNYLKNNIKEVKSVLNDIKPIKKVKPKEEKIEKKYTREEVIRIVENYNKNVEELCKIYSKKELIELYYGIYESKPLSNWDKLMIAETIKGHINTTERAKWFLDRIKN